MKFLCDSCGTKYAISDDRVRGRVLKIRCKKCDFVITVREDVQTAAAVVKLPSGDDLDRAFDASRKGADEAGDQTTVGDVGSMFGGKPAAEPSDWYVSFDGEQEGPFDLARAIDRVRREQGTEKEAHAWRPGYLVWLPVEEVPELAPALPSKPVRAPVRASTATPIATGRGSGAVAAQIVKDPSGPRAALAVSAGARAAPARAAAPAIPADAKPTGLPSRGRAGATRDVDGASLTAEATAQHAPAPMFPTSSATVEALAPSDPQSDAAPELPISSEASGLVNLAHLSAAAFGGAPAGPAMLNGHTAGHRKLQTGRQRALQQEPITAGDTRAGAASNGPVVVVAGVAQGGTHPLFKWAAVVALIACVGLGAGVWYLLTHRPSPDTIIVTEHARRADDTPIMITDPVTGKVVAADPKKVNPAAGKRPSTTSRTVAATAGTQVPAKPEEGLSGSQRALANLYKDDGDRVTPHDVPGVGGAHGAQGGQVSQPAIIAVVTANRRALNLCYQRVLKHDQSLKQGRVVVQVSVGISGRVSSVTIPDPQYANSELGQCFTQAVKRWNFPASDAPYATEFPFILQSQ